MMKNKIFEYIKVINSRLLELNSIPNELYSILYESMQYSLMAGGKRLRPLLSIAACDILGIDYFEILDYACALEMIHTYSLIHDDLPAMDNDDLRRGLPTNHVKFGEDIAILSGDALLNKAFNIMINKALISKNIQSELNGIAYIFEAAGPDGMIGGQTIDIIYTGENTTESILKKIHELKTGKMIKASLCFPAIVANKKEELLILENISDHIGLAFQIKDDILDVVGNKEQMGKTLGKDKNAEKTTYISLYGLEKSKHLLNEHINEALKKAESLNNNSELLKYLIGIISSRNN